jgi:ABC-type transporter MlaC component
MTHHSLRFALAFSLACGFGTGLIGTGTAWADAPKPAPAAPAPRAEETFVRSKHKDLLTVAKQKAKADREKDCPAGKAASEAFTAKLDGVVDFRAMAEASLGDYWKELPEPQRAEFVQLLRRIASQNYLGDFAKTADYDVTYQGAEDKNGGVLVQTSASETGEAVRKKSVRVGYLVRKANGKLMVADIETEGVSLVQNYKSQFRKVVQRHVNGGKAVPAAVEELMKVLSKRVKDGQGAAC